MKKLPLFGVVFFLWLLTFVGYMGYQGSQIEETVTPNAPPSVIVVLGAGLHDNHPSPILIERLHIAAYWGKRYPSVPIVPSGGLGRGQTITEARAMADYLQNLGVEPSRIVLEDQSKTTFQNIVLTTPILKSLGIARDASIWIVTSDFHAPRAGWIAQHAGWYQAHVLSAHTPLLIRPFAWFREYFSWIKGWVFNEF